MNKPTEISIAYVMLNEDILLEDRLQYLKDNTKTLSTDHDDKAKHKTTADIVQHFADHGDPTKNKQHTQFAISMYRNKTLKQEDAPRLKDALTEFDKHKAKLKPEEKQLTVKNYPTTKSIEDKIAPHLGSATTNKEKTTQTKENLDIPGKHELKYEDKSIKIFHLKDKETSQKLYGKSNDSKPGAMPTSWCTATQSGEHNMFNHYHKEGAIHVIHRKADGAVFQMHPESNSFMDRKDDPISPEDFKSIAPSLHKAWKEKPELV